jgi:2-polyprenyl-6-methoxyphenol hydroxylase-like FAD-dependent oxidoreductase
VYDVIVVGARCAGAPTAMLFARAGYRVLLLERVAFPRDTLSTLYIHQPGIALLDHWGVLEDVVATGCPPITSALHQVGDVRLEGCSAPVAGMRAAYAPRRHLLDGVLVRAAIEAGVEFRDNCAVTGLVSERERVVGIRCRAKRATWVERAALVVGADGMRSTVATLVDAPITIQHPRMTCVYYSFWGGVQARFEAYGARDRWVGCAPTNDGLTLVGAYFPQRDFDQVRGRAASAYLEAIRTVAPGLHARLMAGSRQERLFGYGAQHNFFRHPSGPGWVLVGDAGHHKDSISADGITDAFWQAHLLVSLVGADLHDEPKLSEALIRFREHRDRALRDRYRGTLSIARLRPDRRAAMLAAVAADPAQVEAFFTGMAGGDRDGLIGTLVGQNRVAPAHAGALSQAKERTSE